MSIFRRNSASRRWSLMNSFGIKSDTKTMPGKHGSPIRGGGVKQGSPTRQRCDTDPDTMLEVFQCHWLQIVAIIERPNGQNNNKLRATGDDVQAVLRYLDQMLLLLVEEKSSTNGSQGPILQFLLCENIMERVCSWCVKNSEFHQRLKLELLKLYEMIINQGNQPLIVHKPLIRPLLSLLASCADCPNTPIETHLILVLNQLCVALTQNHNLLELFFSASTEQGPARFFMFSLLIPYVHKEGPIGQQARDALLLIMALSSQNENIGMYIAENSDFCPVLATGLSGLYSSLPRKLDIQNDDWSRLNREDWLQIPDLVMFLNSLEFCNAVVQVAHPLVRNQLLNFIYNGFLVPVLGPALHQDLCGIPVPLFDMPAFRNSMEEIIAATAYLDLFVRQITEPALMRTFLRFILTGKHDEIVILDSLVTRINSNTRLCMVSLAFFKTLVDLNCEEVMYQLIFSQRRSLKGVDLYGKAAEKFLSLTPTCCVPDWNDSPQNAPSTPELQRAACPDPSMSFPPGSYGSRLDHYETSYIDYLKESKANIHACAKSCLCWSQPYDGERPAADSLIRKSGDKTTTEEEAAIVDRDAANPGKKRSSTQLTIDSLTSGMESLKIKSHGQTKGDSRKNSIVDMSPRKPSSASFDAVPGGASGEPNGRVVAAAAAAGDDVESQDSGTSDMDRSQDDGDHADLNVFLHSLRKVKTPDDDDGEKMTIEESIREIDVLIKGFKFVDPDRHRSGSAASQQAGDYDYRYRTYSDVSELSLRLRTDSVLSESMPSDVNLSEFESNASASETLQAIPTQELSVSREGSPAVQDNADVNQRSAAQPTYAGKQQDAKSDDLGPPNIGPFLTVILQKFESLMQNTFYVNLLLTGVIARLAYYPQPLLKSFLINPNLVFQPQIKSLIQVLGSVKHKIDCYSYTVDNFESLLLKARRFLAWRDSMQGVQDVSKARGDSMFIPSTGAGTSAGGVNARIRTISAIPEIKQAEKRRTSFSDFFRRSPQPDKDRKGQRLEKLLHGGYRYINSRPIIQPIQPDPAESIKVKNSVYAAIVLEEFLKELAAISQEHAVLSGVDDGYDST
ncbi:FHF complex subunit HOOK-interacting protein 1B-like isoform X2 [Tubulanus polymorphus]|uniref:FHF complex subunit HOOK-interacting protein 1B-like isoform X2 n=1 Tax=Tubulanus polymorphus TaxID=672921 RepID=UPI003DA3DD3F